MGSPHQGSQGQDPTREREGSQDRESEDCNTDCKILQISQTHTTNVVNIKKMWKNFGGYIQQFKRNFIVPLINYFASLFIRIHLQNCFLFYDILAGAISR